MHTQHVKFSTYVALGGSAGGLGGLGGLGGVGGVGGLSDVGCLDGVDDAGVVDETLCTSTRDMMSRGGDGV
jgi:hypothetical protein